MSVLERSALEESPLADLHAIASELSIDGYRRLRREQLIDAILAQQGASAEPERGGSADLGEEESVVETEPRRRRGRRGGSSRAGREAPAEVGAAESEAFDATTPGAEGAASEAEGEIVEGEVEVLPNGSGFLRVQAPDSSEDDIYISAAQVRRCELISGDRVAGPKRPPRRSERFASLYRVDTINGRPASELADRVHFDELPVAFPNEPLDLGAEDPTLEAIGRLTPIGKGSRVTIVGSARAGKSEALRQLAGALAGVEDLHLFVALAGVRPEEIADWESGPAKPMQAVSFAASTDAKEQAVASVVDTARRVVGRGADAAVLIDTLDGVRNAAASRAMAAARNLRDGGSLTVIATASEALGGETTVIALDAGLTARRSFPALDLARSGTLRPELLVGEDGAASIARAREDQ